MYCTNCGTLLQENASFCHNCGNAVGAVRTQYPPVYPLWRVAVFSFITLGIFFLYWFGITWKQLSMRTVGREHHPFWHVMTLFVPLYGFYVVHNHFMTIKNLQDEAEVRSSIVLPWPLIIFLVGTSAIPLFDEFVLGNELSILSWAIPASLIILTIWGQANLNRYWVVISAGESKKARFSPGEITTSVLGFAFAALIMFGVFGGPATSINSVFEADPAIEITIGETTTETITSWLEVDAYRFMATGGERYVIETSRSPLDTLDDVLLILWDADGMTILESEERFGTIADARIEWTAPSSDFYYLTAESAGPFTTGTYTFTLRRDIN